MKRIHILIGNTLNRQIEEAMLRMGLYSKSEFFRMLALNCVKDLNIPQTYKAPENNTSEPLTDEEKKLFFVMNQEPQSVDTLIEKMGWPVSIVCTVLMQLLLKDRVKQNGSYWTRIV